MFSKILSNVREKCPLIHNITNYVTVNDVANILLACGGSPIMSDDEGEVEEITAICGGPRWAPPLLPKKNRRWRHQGSR